MLVKIRLFARLRDIAGAGELERDVPPGATPQIVWEMLAAEHPELARYTGVISCAVNEEYARFTTALEQGDEVAFLPPVSGGSAARHQGIHRNAQQ
jgi:molybdopterin converting factor subunit 1